MKKIKLILILCILSFTTLGIILILQMTNSINLFWNGFAVDEDGYLYIGKDSEIEVFDKDRFIKAIYPRTNRSYVFTIQSENKIWIATSGWWDELDLNGNVLSEHEDSNGDKYNCIYKHRNEFQDINGKRYRLSNSFFRYKIYQLNKEGQSIEYYKMSLLDYIAKLLLVFSTIIIFIFSPYVIVQLRKNWELFLT